MYTRASLKNVTRKFIIFGKVSKIKGSSLTKNLLSRICDSAVGDNVQKAEKQEDKLANLFVQQQKVFQQSRVVQSQNWKTIKQLYEQFTKSREDLEKNHDTLLTDAHELKKKWLCCKNKL